MQKITIAAYSLGLMVFCTAQADCQIQIISSSRSGNAIVYTDPKDMDSFSTNRPGKLHATASASGADKYGQTEASTSLWSDVHPLGLFASGDSSYYTDFGPYGETSCELSVLFSIEHPLTYRLTGQIDGRYCLGCPDYFCGPGSARVRLLILPPFGKTLHDVTQPEIRTSVTFDYEGELTPGNYRVQITTFAGNLGADSYDECDFDVDFKFVIVFGDVNQDGMVNLLDVEPFVDVLMVGYQIEADINLDGAVNLLDVGPFVDLLTGG